MGKKIPSFLTKLAAEGTQADRHLVKSELLHEAKKLADKMPTYGPDRLMYVRNLLTRAFSGDLDQEVFKEFVRMTNSYLEVESCSARAKLISRKVRR